MGNVLHAVLLAGVLVSCGGGAHEAAAPASKSGADLYIDDLAHGRAANPEWTKLEAAAGKFIEVKSEKASGDTVVVVAAFERTEKQLTITLDASKKASGLTWSASPELLEMRTRELVQRMNEGDFAGAEKHFGGAVRDALPADKLSAAWKMLEKQAGRYHAIDGVKRTPAGMTATASFERTKILVKVAYDEHDEVAGLFFAPETEWSPPPYARLDAVDELDVMVGDDPALPGNITMPKGTGKVPAVVLIHGSGPGDRDEAIGGVRVFKDLALGLAARGIAVLRYDKRSRVSPKGIVTEKDEVLDPAATAIALLKKTPRVDRVFVIGHSQGGNLAPRIAASSPDIAGYVVMAGNTRPLQDLVVDQYSYFASLHPDSEELKKKVEEAKDFKKAVEDPALKPTDVPKSPFGGGVTGAYFLYQRGYDPVKTAKELALPLLVLQGGRDYQVSDKDFTRWQQGLAGATFATLKQYPAANHLFVAGTGAPNPEEYEKPAHVDEQVITDIATWVLKTK